MLIRIFVLTCVPGFLFAQEVTRDSAAQKIKVWQEQLSAMTEGLKVLSKAVSKKMANDLPARIKQTEKKLQETKAAIEGLDQKLREKNFLPPEGVREYFQEVSNRDPSDNCSPGRSSP